ncbi:hypothetical protein X943_000847 [Babesia divergens]|uniref:Kinetochore protein SPC25 n=1 Tax=Babesia divergens TaxID=32595 RepID=A0AAD9GEF5_BABDI|nr:hypothetical protein X943_000847 [Babesia divergens]
MHKGLYETQRDIQRANSERGYIICAYKQRYIETVQEYQSLSESTWNLNLRYFNNILGLKFSSNGGTIMVAFCRLSQTEPEKEGYIILGITGNNMRGLSSVPHVQEFDTLIDQLDKGLAFGVFLCRVRNAFRALL